MIDTVSTTLQKGGVSEKTGNVKAKAGPQPTWFIRKVDQQCHQGNRLLHTSGAKASGQASTQGQSIKDPWVEKTKGQGPESLTIARSNNSEFSAKARRDKKKDRRRNNRRQSQQEGSTPATRVNAAEQGGANKKKKR